MSTEIDRILDQLDREHQGDPWHGSPLHVILSGINAQSAAQRPIPNAKSIWELVLHMTGWKREVARRLTGSPAGMPDEGDWPTVGEATEDRWRAALDRLEAAHDELIAAVNNVPESKLYDATRDLRNLPLGTGVTYYELLHGIVQHDVYHAGQIAILRKAFTKS